MLKENVLLRPAVINVNAIGQLEGYTHQASLFCVNDEIYLDEIEIINELLSNENDIEFGISCLPVNGLVVRLLGYKSEQLFGLLQKLANVLSEKKIKEISNVA